MLIHALYATNISEEYINDYKNIKKKILFNNLNDDEISKIHPVDIFHIASKCDNNAVIDKF